MHVRLQSATSGVSLPITVVLVASLVLGLWYGTSTKNTTLALAQASGGSDLPDRMIAGYEPMIGLSIADWVDDSAAVAEVVVLSAGDVRFNTPGGAAPTPDPLDEEFDGMFLFQPVVLNVTSHYKGNSSVTGFVVAETGGTIGGYTYAEQPRMEFLTAAEGMVFLQEAPTDWASNPPAWYGHLLAVAAELNVGGANYQPRLRKNWYQYEAGAATSSWEENRTMPISQLRQEVNDAL